MTKEPAEKQQAAALACQCEACVRDGIHEPSCGVHDKPARACTCGRSDQAKGAS